MSKISNFFGLHKSNFNIIGILVLGLLTRIFLANFGTLTLDQNTFIAWSQRLVDVPWSRFYNAWSDYLPGYLYILWFLAKIKTILSISPTILYKLPAILSDVGIAVVIYLFAQKYVSRGRALVASSVFLFNPAILANSTFWGQVDSLTAFFSLLSIWLAGFSPLGAGIALAMGTAIKPQAAFALFALVLIAVRNKWRIKEIAPFLISGIVVFAALFIPFAGTKFLPVFIWERVQATVNQYPYTSVNAFNLWSLVGMWKADNVGLVGYQTIGSLLAAGVPLLFLVKLLGIKKEKQNTFDPVVLLAVGLLSSFLFMTRMHERHMLAVLAPLALAAAAQPLLLVPYAVLSTTYLANLKYAYVWITQDFQTIFSTPVISLLAIINLLSLMLLMFGIPPKIILLLKRIKEMKFFPGGRKVRAVSRAAFPKTKLEGKTARYLLLLILAFSLVARILFLDTPQKEYFDEVYHAFTARVMLHGDPKAWEWWNPHPTGYAYEWTHPPLAKLGMWGSMALLGENSFAWRLPQALLGTAIVFLVFKIAQELLEDDLAAVLSAAVFSLEGLPLVMSRIGMNDTYFLFFALLSFLLFAKEKYFFSALALGLAASSKWTTMYLIPILGIFFLATKRKIKPSLFWFLLLPPAIYLASYIPMFLSGHSWDQFLEVQKQMWWYHTNLKATHAYTSPAFTWPLMLRPIWLYVKSDALTISNIYAMGNPIVFWFGLVAVVGAGIDAVLTQNKKLGMVIFAYLAFFVPWVASPRIMFLYHYLPSIPFLAVASGYTLRKNPKLIIPFLTLALTAFLYFYPHYTGMKIPVWLDNTYYWMESWR